MIWLAAAAAAALIAAALLVALLRPRMPRHIARGKGSPLLLLPPPGEPVGELLKALAPLSSDHLLIGLDIAGGDQTRAARALLERQPLVAAPIAIAHGAGCRAALRLGEAGLARGLVLIAPPRRASVALEPSALFPPTIIVSDVRAEHAALMHLPTVERIAAPRLGPRPHLKRPDLAHAAIARLEAISPQA